MKSGVVLGIETSCDETAAALVINGKLIADRTTTQLLHEAYGGVVPELASRAHERLLMPAVSGVLKDAGVQVTDIDAVAATYGPGLAGALLVGVSFAKGLAKGLNIPFLGINHLEGHLWGAEITHGHIPQPFLGMIISGGHTITIDVQGFGKYTLLGRTHDDAVGELLDKAGRMLGYSFPAGASIDQDAMNFTGKPVHFPRARVKCDDRGFSFSGLKTAVLYYLRDKTRCQGVVPDSNAPGYAVNRGGLTGGKQPEGWTLNSVSQGNGYKLSPVERAAVSTGMLEAVSDMLINGLSVVWDNNKYKALVISGGVASSRFLRTRFERFADERNIPLYIPPSEHCTDNGAMIAYVGYRYMQSGYTSPLDLAIDPALGL
ncbi:MAG: tRNA (adenosine(37)-N6)-threonylcarbamoyltransferase complex transferase subunit TsaD [Candidatus Hatepunaea meridiana]|nr:tRNA (adenosine(37)-N6)-threonylcarbamoyltransferase complex transferase subunit TsaD [Candidatus Hatepunaea meridiana]